MTFACSVIDKSFDPLKIYHIIMPLIVHSGRNGVETSLQEFIQIPFSTRLNHSKYMHQSVASQEFMGLLLP